MTTGNNIGSTKSLTFSVSTDKGTNNFLISETAYTYMRAKTITFFAKGLKPNTKYYPFFGGMYVGKYCSITSGEFSSSALITNALGDITGNFFLPGGTFVCGTHTFELVDNVILNSSNEPVAPDPLYGSLSAQYEAFGSLRFQQTQATSAVQINQVNNTSVGVTNIIPATGGVNSTTVKNNITNNVSVTPAAAVVPPIQPPAPVVCEEWWFEYRIVTGTGGANQRLTTVTSNPVPPTNPWTSDANISNVVYVSTTVLSGNQYEHIYSATVKSVTTTGNRMRQTWQGPDTTATPPGQVSGSGLQPLSTFRPSGLTDNDRVEILKTWTRDKNIPCPTTFGLRTPTRVDPIAQSFFVDPAKHPNGMFITSIDLFFKTVDQTLPVTLELRNMSNGLPGPIVLPHGIALVPGFATTQSNDATSPTKFIFDTPIFVAPGEEYCFVVKSSSLGYNLWCSRLGEKDVTTNKIIDTQPFDGTLFKSENDSTWIPDSYEDVKFIMRHAQFNTQTISNIKLRPQKTPDNTHYVGTSHVLPLSYMSTVRGTNVIKIKCPLHGLITGDKVTIANIAEPVPVATFNGFVFSSLNGDHTVTVIDGDEFQINITGQLATKTGSVQTQDVFNNINPHIAPLPITPAFTPTETVINTNTLTTTTERRVINNSSVPSAPNVTSSTSFTLYTNVLINELNVDYINTNFDNTRVQEQIRLAEGYTSLSDPNIYRLNSFIPVNTNGDYTALPSPQLFASAKNEVLKSSSLTNQPSLEIDMQLSTSSKDLSPVIDTTGMSLLTKSFKIDNQLNEIDNLVELVQSGTYTSSKVGLWDLVKSTSVEAGLLIRVSNTKYYVVTVGGTLSSIDPIHLTGTAVNGSATLEYKTPSEGLSLYYKYAYNDDTSSGNSEINPETGSALAKYKSTINRLSQSYSKLTVFVSANVPRIGTTNEHTMIDVYIRTSTDEFTHVDEDWQYCPFNGDYTAFLTPSRNRMIIDEFMFEVDNLPSFNIFDIKIVMRTPNSSYVPKIFGIRAIADKQLI